MNDDDLIVMRMKRQASDDDMDMTPMVDVTFLLLIFFMITAAFRLQKSFEVPTPDVDQPSSSATTLEEIEQDSDYVVVRVDEFNTFHVAAATWDSEREAPTEQDLLVQMRRAVEADAAGGRARRLLIMAHGDAHHERVVMAIDAGNDLGMEEVKIVTVEESSW